MTNGYYFFSKKDSKSGLFYYKRVCKKRSIDSNKNKESSERNNSTNELEFFPVYCILNNKGCDFYYHDIKTKDNYQTQHFVKNILSIDFINYEDIQRISSNSENLSGLEEKRTEEENKEEDFTVNKTVGKLESNFRNIEILYPLKKDFDKKFINDEETNKDILLIKDLFLDFLWDFEHSRVFELSENIISIKQKIKSNKLISGIINKSNYYYYRLLFDRLNENKAFQKITVYSLIENIALLKKTTDKLEETTDKLEETTDKLEETTDKLKKTTNKLEETTDKLKNIEDLQKITAFKIYEYERKWLSYLLDPSNENIIIKSDNWFFPPDVELKSVLFEKVVFNSKLFNCFKSILTKCVSLKHSSINYKNSKKWTKYVF